jgi:hypothetical protein
MTQWLVLMTASSILLVFVLFLVPIGAALLFGIESFGYVALAMAVGVVLLVAYAKWRQRGTFGLPKCLNGTCGPRDYALLPVDSDLASFKFKCRCGVVYMLKGNRFSALDESGCVTFYKSERHWWSGWDAEWTECTKGEPPSSPLSLQEASH